MPSAWTGAGRHRCCPLVRVTAAVCPALSPVIPASAAGREGAHGPHRSGAGTHILARADVWRFLGWVTLGRLLALSEPIGLSSLLFSSPVGQDRRSGRAGLVTCETTKQPSPLGPPPLSHLRRGLCWPQSGTWSCCLWALSSPPLWAPGLLALSWAVFSFPAAPLVGAGLPQTPVLLQQW